MPVKGGSGNSGSNIRPEEKCAAFVIKSLHQWQQQQQQPVQRERETGVNETVMNGYSSLTAAVYKLLLQSNSFHAFQLVG
jgi:hypothetical protein